VSRAIIGHFPQGKQGSSMGMTDCNRQRIGCISLGNLWQIEKNLNHFLNLVLCCLPVPDNGLLNLQRRIFIYRQASIDPCNQSNTTGLPEFQSTLNISGKENVLNSNRIGLEFIDNSSKACINYPQSLAEVFSLARMDSTIIKVQQAIPFSLDDPIPSDT
jgi:hypothetical protein